MAERLMFLGTKTTVSAMSVEVPLRYSKDFSCKKSELNNNVMTLHEALADKFDISPTEILEVSTASVFEEGCQLSPFYMTLDECCLESLYQSCKIFVDGPVNVEQVRIMRPSDAKTYVKENHKSRLRGFFYQSELWGINDGISFFNKLYCMSALRGQGYSGVEEYSYFTDIFHNPSKSLNCNARGAAMLRVLIESNSEEEAFKNRDSWVMFHKKHCSIG